MIQRFSKSTFCVLLILRHFLSICVFCSLLGYFANSTSSLTVGSHPICHSLSVIFIRKIALTLTRLGKLGNSVGLSLTFDGLVGVWSKDSLFYQIFQKRNSFLQRPSCRNKQIWIFAMPILGPFLAFARLL